MAENNVAEMVARIVTPQLIAHFEGAVTQLNAEADLVKVRAQQAITDAVARVETEARVRIDDVLSGLPELTEVQSPFAVQEGEREGFNAIDWFRTQAKSRAWRTLVQGLLAVVVVAVGNVVTQVIASGSLNVFSWDDWKLVFALAGSAALAALLSYLQNALGIKPPKAQ